MRSQAMPFSDLITVYDESSDAARVAPATRPISQVQAILRNDASRKILILLLIMLAWEAYGRWRGNELLFPTFSATVQALYTGIVSGGLLRRMQASLRMLLIGYSTGFATAMVLTILAVSFTFAREFLLVVTSMFNPLPAIALLPLALMWFGIGDGSIAFVLVHSVLWPVALNTLSGFLGVPNTLKMVGRNYGLTGLRFALKILVPAALPSIFTGVKIGWAFAWRTLIAAELVFGVSSGSGGLGWYIYEQKNALETPSVFAGILLVIVIGVVVENFVFRPIERRTIRRWGMQS